MKKAFTLCVTLVVFLCSFLSGQTVTLLGTLNPYPGTKYADIWGYTDGNGREYAIMGVTGGTSIIDVTDPANPVQVTMIPGPNSFYEWRDIKTHSHYAYVVTEGTGSGSGMQIIDLANLPISATLVNTYTATFVTAHDLYIDNGYAYVVGASNGSGVHILDLSDPVNPAEVGYYGGNGYVHDIYVYDDTAYVSSEGEYGVVDVTNKSNPTHISSSASLPGIYAHSGWLTEDKRYFVACEEFNVRDLTVWDLQDRTTWDLVVPTWQTSSNSPIHNVYVLGNYAHISYYEDGYVVLDISDPTNPVQVAQYDTDPTPSTGDYKGAWGCYPYLPSGNVLISDMQTGLYVLQFEGITPVELKSFTAFCDGKNVNLNWSTSTEKNNKGFEIQRKADNTFITIGFVQGAGTTTETKNYDYSDRDVSPGKYSYRLKQIDFNGTYKYSDEITTEVPSPSEFSLLQNYPNPFNPATKIKFTIPENTLVNLSVYNSLGEVVTTLINNVLNSGNHSIDFDASELPSGIYFARLKAGDNVKSIKMSLLK
jgi:choice-of-anchor B domain-containing protein